MNSFSASDITWAALGLGYAVPPESITPLHSLTDPESHLIASLSSLLDDTRGLGLILRWIANYSSLLHVERLARMSNKLDALELAVLATIARKSSAADDRWKSIEEMARKKLKGVTFPLREQDRLLITLHGEDQDFKKYGIALATVTPAPSKKIKPIAYGSRWNLFFRLRAILGNHMRADAVAAVYALGATNGYQVKKLISCSIETAYRARRNS